MPAEEKEARISLHIRPGARENRVEGFTDGAWRVKIAAPPVEGKANRELLDFLAERLGVRPGSLDILRGHTSRNKLVEVRGLSQEEVERRLTE